MSRAFVANGDSPGRDTPFGLPVGRAAAGIEGRHWLRAIAAGVTVGTGQALHIASSQWDRWPQVKLDLLLVIASRWAPLLAVVSCALLLATSALQMRPEAARPRHDTLWVMTFAVGAALLFDPICWWALCRTVHRVLAVPVVPFWAGLDAPKLLMVLWSRSIPMALILATMWIGIERYLHGARRSARALATAQLRLAGAERRALDDELRSAQASVEPAFLFGTLSLIQERFDTAPVQARALLDALIQYLRAALPAADDSGCTVGQQIELVSAYLKIERIRRHEGLQTCVDMPAALSHLPIAPLLVLPLTMEAVRHAAGAGDHGRVEVRVSSQDSHLVVEIDAGRVDPSDDPSSALMLAQLKSRLAALYGSNARLALTSRPPDGIGARLDIPLAYT